jgi:periplasmic glucans biosynthesis protein
MLHEQHGLFRRRRSAPLALAFTLALLGKAACAFGLDDVAAQARDLARAPYRGDGSAAPAWLKDLSYDEYRNIRFRPKQALWHDPGLPFELQFFHTGRGFARPLKLYEVAGSTIQPLAIKRDAFDYGRHLTPPPGSGPTAEVSGFRVHYPLNKPDYKDELIAFLGASYFRALGAGQHYGMSARGVAVDTVGGSSEEFPAFTAAWFERPARDASSLTVYTLLEGPRVTGAYRFVVQPGATTLVDVTARLYLRAPVAMLGIAPLTSMFYAGENQPPADGFRPEIHDSDGLQIAAADGEWIWRPLTNPKRVFVSSFALNNPRGFGLMQRDRSFASYEDLEARYERRPSVWIEPQGDWGAGRVEMLEYHIPDETHDNVAAYWVPARMLPPGEPINIAYRMYWLADDTPRMSGARVVQSRRGYGYRKTPAPPDAVQFHVDFAGPPLQGLDDDAPIEAMVTGDDNVRGLHAHAYPNPAVGGWRMTLDFQRRDLSRPVELRAYLRMGPKVLSETWAYALPPE